MTINEAYWDIVRRLVVKQVGNISPSMINDALRDADMGVLLSITGNPNAYTPGMPVAPQTLSLTQKIKDDLRNLTSYGYIIQNQNGIFPLPSDYYIGEPWLEATVYTNPEIQGGQGSISYVSLDVVNVDRWTYRRTSKIITSPCAILTNNGYLTSQYFGQLKLTYYQLPQDPYWDFDYVNGVPTYVPAGGSITVNTMYKHTTLAVPRLSQSQEFQLGTERHNEIVNLAIQILSMPIHDQEVYKASGEMKMTT